MNIKCPRCSCSLIGVDPHLGGRPARCEKCGGEFIVPFDDAERLLEWARSAPWVQLEEAIRTRIGAGHTRTTVSRLVRIFEKRREWEIWRLAREEKGKVLSPRERIWEATERRFKQRHALEELRRLNPSEFEELVADLFNSQGYRAKAIGGTDDDGIDVEIRKPNGELWGVAQCKRYGPGSSVSSKDIRAFGGTFLLSGAPIGFYFTTGRLTRDARETARRFRWLTVYEGPHLMRHIREVQQRS